MQYLHYVLGAILIFIGIRAVYTQKVTIGFDFWEIDLIGGKDDLISTNHSGLIGMLIGIIIIAVGVTSVIKDPFSAKAPTTTTSTVSS